MNSKRLAFLLAAMGTLFLAACGREAPTFAPRPGALAVLSDPPGAAIALDGEPTGRITPDTLTSLRAGDHIVRVTLEGYAPQPDSVVVRVAPDQTARADFMLNALLPPTPRIVLLESFSNVSCVGCPALAATLAGLMGNRNYGPERVVLVKYSMSWPSATDPMHMANAAENDARMTFYQSYFGNGIPTLAADGTLAGASGNPPAFDDLKQLVDQELLVNPGFGIGVVADVSGTAVPVTVTLKPDRRVDLTGCVLDIVLVENPVFFDEPPGTEGETEFHWVMRDFSVASSTLPTLQAGQDVVLTGSLTRNQDWISENLIVVAFVQNTASRAVLQAGSTVSSFGNVHPARTSDGSSAHPHTAGGTPR